MPRSQPLRVPVASSRILVASILLSLTPVVAGCGGGGSSSSPVTSASTTVNNTVNGTAYDLGIGLSESSSSSNTGSGVTYTLSIHNSGSTTVNIPAYTDSYGAVHPTYILNVTSPNSATYSFGSGTATTTIAVTGNSTYTDQTIVGPQYYISNGTYNAGAQITYAPSTTTTVGTVTINVG